SRGGGTGGCGGRGGAANSVWISRPSDSHRGERPRVADRQRRTSGFEQQRSSGSTHLDLSEAAVDEQLAAGDVAAVVRGEERYRGGDFICPTDATERNPVAKQLVQALAVLLRELAKTRRIARSRTDHVDADFSLPQVRGPSS